MDSLPDDVLVAIGITVAKLCRAEDMLELSNASKRFKGLFVESEETLNKILWIRNSKIHRSLALPRSLIANKALAVYKASSNSESTNTSNLFCYRKNARSSGLWDTVASTIPTKMWKSLTFWISIGVWWPSRKKFLLPLWSWTIAQSQRIYIQMQMQILLLPLFLLISKKQNTTFTTIRTFVGRPSTGYSWST